MDELGRITQSLKNTQILAFFNAVSRRAVGLVLGISLLVLTGCSLYPESVTRYIRVIAQVEVGGKVVEGSTVMGLRWKAGDKGRMYIERSTEAVILDLGSRGTVYVLDAYMTSNGLSNGGYWPKLLLRTFGIPGQGTLKNFPVLRSAKGRHKVRPIFGNPPTLPLMVSFRDEAKRETMFEVKPKNFPNVFGSDVRFIGLWFEFTDLPVTEAIAKRLPVAIKPNQSYYTAFPKRDAQGNLIPAVRKKFPQKIGKFAFMEKDF